MPVTVAGLKVEIPALASVQDGTLQLYLNVALDISGINDRMTYYCAAHLYTLSIQGNQQGEVVSETIGPLSKTYKTQAETGGDSFFTKTEYGRIFLILENRNINTKITGIVA